MAFGNTEVKPMKGERAKATHTFAWDMHLITSFCIGRIWKHALSKLVSKNMLMHVFFAGWGVHKKA